MSSTFLSTNRNSSFTSSMVVTSQFCFRCVSGDSTMVPRLWRYTPHHTYLANLTLHQPYTGEEEVIIGDGNGLSITHTGLKTLPSSTHSLTLSNMLCVSEIKKNLISAYKLCNTNQVSIQFYPSYFQGMDLSIFIRFTNLVENRFKTKIGCLFSDNGGEFLAPREFLSSKDISHLTSPSHTPKHNGFAERQHRHIVETGLNLLSRATIPNTYWTYAFAIAIYLINRMPTPTLSLQSPFKTLFKVEPNYNKLRIFGCLYFPWLRPYTTNKLEQRQKLVFS